MPPPTSIPTEAEALAMPLAGPEPITHADIGTERCPLRASSLVYLNCPLRFMLYLQSERSAGEAASTGTLAHKGIEEWIRGSSLAAAHDAMRHAQQRFRLDGTPPGDLEAAGRWLRRYTEDPRNAPLGKWPADREFGRVVHVEAPCKLVLDPVDFDPTGAPIVVYGTLDQLREGPDGALRLWDVKSGKIRENNDVMVLEYLYQTVAYAKGAEQMLGRPVGVGGIIALQGYGARSEERQGVFLPCSIPYDEQALVLDSIVSDIALIRSGYVSPRAGPHCQRCYVAAGLADCLRRLKEMIAGAGAA